MLSQESGFDNLGALALDLDRIGCQYAFLWPKDEGPIQGSIKVAIDLKSKWGFKGPIIQIKSGFQLKSLKKTILANNSVVFIQTPYLNDHYIKSSQVLLSGVRLGYLNYGVNLADTPEYHYGLEIYKDISLLLVANDFEEKQFTEKGVKPENILVSGIPVIHEILYHSDNSNSAAAAAEAKAKAKAKTLKLLWAPYWAGTWSNWEKALAQLYPIAMQYPQLEITVRAHPLLSPITARKVPKEYQTAKATHSDSESIFQQFLSLPNVKISKNTIIADCRSNDLLLTDGVSIIAFWAATGKQQGIIRRESSPNFSTQFREIEASAESINIESSQMQNWIKTNLELHSRNMLNTNKLGPQSTWFSPNPNGPAKILQEWLNTN